MVFSMLVAQIGPRILLVAVSIVSTLLLVGAYALPWIEDEEYSYGACSWAYAYVGAYTNGEKLVNIKHQGYGDLYSGCTNTAILVYKIYRDSSDYTWAETLVQTYVLAKDNIYQLDAEARAYIEASMILSR